MQTLDINQLKTIMKNFSKVKILVIGDIMLDRFIWGDVKRISPEAPVPVVEVTRESHMPGGAANVSTNIASLQGTSYLCGLIGTDPMGTTLIETLQDCSIDTSPIVALPQRHTTVKDRIIAHNQQVVRIDREHTNDLAKDEIKDVFEKIKHWVPQVDLVIIEDYGKGMITSDLISKVTALAQEHDIVVAVDPKEKHFDYYQNVHVITPNHHEAQKATGITITDEESLLACGNKLLSDLNCKAVLLTRGEHGMSLFQKDQETQHIPTIAQEVFDVSGAGDTVIATFSLALAAGASYTEAAFLSNLAGGIVVGKVGVATVSPTELEDTLCAQLV